MHEPIGSSVWRALDRYHDWLAAGSLPGGSMTDDLTPTADLSDVQTPTAAKIETLNYATTNSPYEDDGQVEVSVRRGTNLLTLRRDFQKGDEDDIAVLRDLTTMAEAYLEEGRLGN